MPLDGGGLVRCRRVVMKEGAADAAHLQPRREARVLHRAKARVDGRQLPKLRVEHSSIAVLQLRGERMLEPREPPAVTPDAGGVARRDCKRARPRSGSPVNSSANQLHAQPIRAKGVRRIKAGREEASRSVPAGFKGAGTEE